MPKPPRPEPKRWLFNDEDRERYGRRFWSMPVRLVKDGAFARLWREPGTIRGGGVVTAVLPVLALHSYPTKPDMPEGTQPEAGWTGWATVSRRRIATLCGVDKVTAGTALRRLEKDGLAQTRRMKRPDFSGGFRTDYRLTERFFPVNGEPFAKIHGSLIYSGTWALLPSHAARHIYLIIAGQDVVRDEESYLKGINEDLGELDDFLCQFDDSDEEARYGPDYARGLSIIRFLAEQRARTLQSLSSLCRLSGLARPTVIEAIRILRYPIFGNRPQDDNPELLHPPIPLVLPLEVDRSPAAPTWYAPDRRALIWHFGTDGLNCRIAEIRREKWPFHYAKPAKGQKKAPKRRKVAKPTARHAVKLVR